MKKFVAFSTVLLLPMFTYAASIDTVIRQIGDWLRNLLPIATGAALLVFIWGLVIFIGQSGEAEARVEGRQKMIWGVVGLFVIVSVWGLVAFLRNTFGINENNPINAPGLPGSKGASQQENIDYASIHPYP